MYRTQLDSVSVLKIRNRNYIHMTRNGGHGIRNGLHGTRNGFEGRRLEKLEIRVMNPDDLGINMVVINYY